VVGATPEFFHGRQGGSIDITNQGLQRQQNFFRKKKFVGESTNLSGPLRCFNARAGLSSPRTRSALRDQVNTYPSESLPAGPLPNAMTIRRCRLRQWLIVPFLLVSTSADTPVLKRNALMFFVRNVRA
jgi:hypothetical protein